MTIQVNDILHFLVGRSASPSTMGAQLDRLRYGLQVTPDPFRARDEVESHLLQQAALLRCIDDFAARREFRVPTKDTTLKGPYKILDKLRKATQKDHGELAINILRAYHTRCTAIGTSQERGLLEVYNYIVAVAPDTAPPPPKNESDMLQAFRTGAAKRARSLAAEAYADSLLALQRHVQVWNKKER